MLLSVLPGRRAQIVAVVLYGIALVAAAHQPDLVDSVLRTLRATDPQTFLCRLESQRHSPVTPQARRQILDSLPREGRIAVLSGSERAKLASAEPVLRLHLRDGVYDVMVIDAPQAYAGLHARAVILISRTLIGLLDAGEMQAVVAHEIAHEYYWDEFEEARRKNDYRQLQELELYCDGIAILTLVRMGVDPIRLTTGIERIGHFNREKFGLARNEEKYPSLSERRRLAKAVARWAAGR